ncbi:TetR family transcriptional regulator [Roseovarius faecimaris]|uniref:TetR family transcriptional regulator n=1 Tax=Roseovarius faecimaris TaxID=2494550 RepID=A0A6I6INA5_9RHOB|nr:TetR family transcriptional regulator C-terminal domain-containing protein [Roseovarius faecimaris]QGX97574.1 TetR family transcriptional regulator [Roseovarius faecimaris]
MTASPTPSSARAAGKAQSRLKLIEAAATAIYRNGLRGATIGEIQAISGLSRGMINLHFNSKENLLLAVAEHLASQYEAHMAAALEGAGEAPQAQLKALFRADLDPLVLNARDVAIWFSFRAEGHATPAFQAQINTRGGGFAQILGGVCAALTPGEDGNPRFATLALMSLAEGLWTDFHVNPDRFDRDEALAMCFYVAERLFPGRFSA